MRTRTPLLARAAALAFALALAAAPAQAQERVDSAAVAFIKAEAQERGQVMTSALWLTDIHGPRLTGSPQLRTAQRWAERQFETWGLTAEVAPWGTFGRGWEVERLSATARVSGPDVAEHAIPLTLVPKAWSPSTGRATAEVVVFNPADADEMERFRGQLRGKVVLLSEKEDVSIGLDPIATRRDAQNLLELANAATPVAPQSPQYPAAAMQRFLFNQAKVRFLAAEAPLAVLEASVLGGTGSIRAMGAVIPVAEGAPAGTRATPWAVDAVTVPQFVVLTEHYNRLMRLVEAGQRVSLDLDFEAEFHDDDLREYNVIAEIPGTDPEIGREIVMVGAHLDSWHAGSGATDNAAGSSVVMEVARVLKAYYDQRGEGPRRTIRFALWSGEEQGLYGSYGYVNEHFATISGYGQPATALGRDHARLSAYYNMDNGSGRLRGVYMQSNPGVEPIFRAWLNAFGDSTAQTLTLANTGGTDHLPFDAAGLPGFQFIQDGLAYGRQTWHGSMDTYDHLVEEDLEQAAALIATFTHHTAERDELLPRKPLRLASGTN